MPRPHVLRVLTAGCTLVTAGGFAVVSHAAPPSAKASPHWQVQTLDPTAGAGTDLVYDSADHVLATVVGNQFWTTRDGRIWTRQRDGADSNVTNLVYDATRRQLVAFALGCGSSTTTCAQADAPGETWTWSRGNWTKAATTGPPRRSGGQMIYDPATGEVLLFGGGGAGNPFLGDTWSWNGRTWKQIPGDHPSPRASAAIAYDAALKSIVLVGGVTSAAGDTVGDTWLWRGQRWTKDTRVELPNRAGSSLAYDPRSRQLLLYGGGIGSFGSAKYLRDTWTYDSRHGWRQHGGVAPTPRAYASMAYDDATGQVVLVSGANANGPIWDAWVWTGATAGRKHWSLVSGVVPPGRPAGHIAYDPDRHQVALFGGGAGIDFLADTWWWDGSHWSQASGPSGRYSPAMVYDAASRQDVLFGGLGAGIGDTTWIRQNGRWQLHQGVGPSRRQSPLMVYDAAHGRVVLFGGYDWYRAVPLGDTWTWDGRRWTKFDQPGPSPSARQNAVMVYDAAHGQVVLFGGEAPGTYGFNVVAHGDTWIWTAQQGWRQVANPPALSPTPRWSASMAYDPASKRVVLFGGIGDGGLSGDTWTWDGSAWSPAVAVGPPPSETPPMVYDAKHRKLLLYYGSSDYLSQTWTWDGSSWTLASGTEPPGRTAGSMVYDDAVGKVVLFGGGSGSGPLNDTWLWDGTQWTQATGAAPAPRQFEAMVYDPPSRHLILACGTTSNGSLGDTWTWG